MLPRLIAGVRILIGAAFVVFGILKLINSEFLYGGLLLEVSKHGEPFDFYERFVINRYVLLHQTLFAYAVACGELLVGASFLTGTLVNVGALGGAFLMVNFGLAIGGASTSQLVVHILFALAFLVLGWIGSGLKWGVDGWLAQRIHTGFVLFPFRLRAPRYMESKTSGSD